MNYRDILTCYIYSNVLKELVINNGDWEVKRASIKLLKNMWIGYNSENIDIVKQYIELATLLQADTLLLQAVA